jgi:flagellar hook-basal body complex protein FliE
MISALNSVSNIPLEEPVFSGALSSAKKAGVQDPGRQEPFGDLLKDAIGNINHLEEKAQHAVESLMTGTGVDIHQAMIASQKATMAFEMVLAVRNKAIQSYQSVMGMQF